MERPLFWHEGLFLQPQHFQLEDLHVQSLLDPFHRFLQPHFWGVQAMEVQETGLTNRTFNLLKGEFIFPGTTHVVFPGNAVIEGRSFEKDWVEPEKPFGVFVGLKKWSDVFENVTVVSKLDNLSEVTTRFASTVEPEEVRNLHHSGPTAQVKRLFYVLKIFWETEMDQLGDYALIPLAQLERSGEEITLSERFVPPCLSVHSSNALLKMVKEIRDQIASRGRRYEGVKRQRGIQTTEFGSQDMRYLLALRSINRYVPLLFHLVESEQIHPWNVYAVLRQLIGEISFFSERVNALGELEDGTGLLSRYEHRNLWKCFSDAQRLVTQILDGMDVEPEYAIQLLYDGTYYAADLSPSVFEGGNRFYLLVDTEVDAEVVVPSLESIAKLGSRESLPLFIARALPGIKLVHLPVPPQQLPRRPRSIYFQIDHHSDHWVQVQKGKNIALYWDAAPQDLKVEMMIVGKI